MYLLRKRIFAVLFLAVLLSYSAFNLIQAYPALIETAQKYVGQEDADLMELVTDVETQMTETLAGRMDFVEI